MYCTFDLWRSKFESKSSEKENEENLTANYECKKCVYEATTLADLKDHEKDNHSNREFKCQECGHVVLTDSDLKGHMEAYHSDISPGTDQTDDTIFLCDQCDDEYKSKVELEAHVKNCHTQEQIDHRCDKCEYVGDSMVQLRQHRQSEHFHFRYFCCACDYETLNKEILKKHKLEKHEDQLTPTRKEKVLPPPKCNLNDPSHSSECCNRKRGAKKPVIYSHEQRTYNGICKAWNKGYCEDAELCKFSHVEIEECKFANFCSRSNCKYWHDIAGKFPFLEEDNHPRRRNW